MREAPLFNPNVKGKSDLCMWISEMKGYLLQKDLEIRDKFPKWGFTKLLKYVDEKRLKLVSCADFLTSSPFAPRLESDDSILALDAEHEGFTDVNFIEK